MKSLDQKSVPIARAAAATNTWPSPASADEGISVEARSFTPPRWRLIAKDSFTRS